MTGKNHYVQVNIYGKRLEELNDFETYLRNFGCDDFWIAEVPIPVNNSIDSGLEEENETIVLSTSLVEKEGPRYSTPLHAIANWKCFGSKTLSTISTSSDNLYDTIDQSVDIPMHDETEVFPLGDCVEQFLSIPNSSSTQEMIKNDGEVCHDPVYFLELSTNCQGMETKQSIRSIKTEVIQKTQTNYEEEQENGEIRNLLDGMIEIVCETESDDSSFYDCDTSLTSATSSTLIQLPTLCGPHPHNRHSEYIESVEMKPSIQTTKSLKNIKIGNIPAKFGERKPLKRTTSEKRITRRKAMKLIRNNSVHPILSSSPPQIMKPIKVPRELSEVFDANQDMLPITEESERVYTDLEPMTSGYEYCDVENNFFDVYGSDIGGYTDKDVKSRTFNPEVSNQTFYHSQEGEEEHFDGNEDDVSYEMDQENLGDVSMKSALFNNSHLEDNENEEQDHPKPKKGRSASEDSSRTVHKIVCQFKNCHKSQNWRKKYGKLRLVDHALTHIKQQVFHCDECNFNSRTTRQIRYHYSQKHPDSQMNRCDLKRLLSKPVESEELKKLWNACYKNSLSLVGEPKLGVQSKQKMSRRNVK